MSDGTQADAEPVAWWRRGLIGLAVLTAAGAAVWAIAHAAPHLMEFYACFVAVPALALFFTRDGRRFRLACTVVGLGLLVVGVVFAVLALFIFAPAALVVLTAGWAERRRTVPLGAASLLIAVVALVGWTIADVQAFRPADAFVVRFDQHGFTVNSDALARLSVNPPPFGPGATGVSTGGTDAGPTWWVSFRPDLSARDKTSLADYLRGLPGVVSVEPCEPPPWGCR